MQTYCVQAYCVQADCAQVNGQDLNHGPVPTGIVWNPAADLLSSRLDPRCVDARIPPECEEWIQIQPTCMDERVSSAVLTEAEALAPPSATRGPQACAGPRSGDQEGCDEQESLRALPLDSSARSCPGPPTPHGLKPQPSTLQGGPGAAEPPALAFAHTAEEGSGPCGRVALVGTGWGQLTGHAPSLCSLAFASQGPRSGALCWPLSGLGLQCPLLIFPWYKGKPGQPTAGCGPHPVCACTAQWTCGHVWVDMPRGNR